MPGKEHSVFLHKPLKKPLAASPKSLFSYWEEFRSDVCAFIRGLELLLIPWKSFRISFHCSTIKLNHAKSTAKTGCRSLPMHSKQWDLRATWYLMMSVMQNAADVQLVFTGYLRAKTATQIGRLRTNIQYFRQTNTPCSLCYRRGCHVCL